MSLSSDEVVVLFDQSEAAYSSGGVSLDDGRLTCLASAVWDADGRLPSTYVLPSNAADCSLRQIAEATFVLLTHYFSDQLSKPFLGLLQVSLFVASFNAHA